jgi:hypothetical protein
MSMEPTDPTPAQAVETVYRVTQALLAVYHATHPDKVSLVPHRYMQEFGQLARSLANDLGTAYAVLVEVIPDDEDAEEEEDEAQ